MGNDRNLDRNDGNLVDKESKASEIVIDEEESSDHGITNDGYEVGEDEEWMEHEEPIDLVDTHMSRNQGYEFRGQNFVGIGRDMQVFLGNMSHVMDFTILENIEANIDPSLSQEVTFNTQYRDSEMDDLTSEGHDLLSSRVILSEDNYRRGCERAYDLESGFYKHIDKLGPSYRKEIERIDLDVSFEADGSRTSEGVT
ncbi:hypothetical protein Tco_0980165 [Tanacetum coccineum]